MFLSELFYTLEMSVVKQTSGLNILVSGQAKYAPRIIITSISFLKKTGRRLALSLYLVLLTACFHLELLELVRVDLF